MVYLCAYITSAHARKAAECCNMGQGKVRTLKEEQDWEVTEDGLYIATRGFLTRRGYCCANRCRNCPYINWRNQPGWHPLAAEQVQATRVSTRAVCGAESMLHYHEQQLQHCKAAQREKHQNMIAHYQNLLERWGYK